MQRRILHAVRSTAQPLLVEERLRQEWEQVQQEQHAHRHGHHEGRGRHVVQEEPAAVSCDKRSFLLLHESQAYLKRGLNHSFKVDSKFDGIFLRQIAA